MSRRRDLMPEEARLWHKVARTVRPYQGKSASEPASQPEPIVPVAKPAPELPHLAVKRQKAARQMLQGDAKKVAPAARHSSAPVPDASGHKRVRRGKLEIDGNIDLHGYRQAEAQTVLAGFLARIRAQGGRCVLVVTGKGRPIDPGEDYITPQPGVIRRRLPEWLSASTIREHVAGFATAHPRHGGTGAYYVLLKARQLGP